MLFVLTAISDRHKMQELLASGGDCAFNSKDFKTNIFSCKITCNNRNKKKYLTEIVNFNRIRKINIDEATH